ncbi:MAG: NUDIX hydrolase [Nanoarchaeota archaeon]
MKTIERNYSVGMPLDPNNRLLLQRKDSGYIFWPNYWCTFGGGMKKGEYPLETIVREIKEENGLELTDIKLFELQPFVDYSKFGDPIERKGFVYYFGSRFDGNLKKVRIGEGAGFSVFDREELVRYNKLGLIVPNNYEVIDRFMNSISH